MKKISIILAMLLCGTVMVRAQQDSVSGMYNEKVVVVGSYTPTLEERQKVNIAPEITDTTTNLEHRFEYEITPKRLTALYMPSRIKAARVISEPTARLYNNYFRIGFGNNISPMLDAYFNSVRNPKISYGTYIKHNSAWGTIGKRVDSIPYSSDYYGPNHWSMTNVGGFFKYIINEKLQLTTDVKYNNDYNLYYGMNDSILHENGIERDSIEPIDYRIGFNHLSWNGGVKSIQTDVKKFGYSADVNVAHLWGGYGQREFTVGVQGDVKYRFPMFEKHKGVVNLHAEWQGWKETFEPDTLMPLGYPLGDPDSAVTARNLVKVNPYVDFMLKDFNFHAGVTIAF